MTTSAVRYIATQGARYHVRPLTLMQREVLSLCTYGVSLAFLCQQTCYPPIQVLELLTALMRHVLIRRFAPAEEEQFADPQMAGTLAVETTPKGLRARKSAFADWVLALLGKRGRRFNCAPGEEGTTWLRA